jgi:hypothetical protein
MVGFLGILLGGWLPIGVAAAREVAYDGGLRAGWVDLGWGPRTLGPGPARVDIGQWKGWIFGKTGSDLSTFGSVSVSIRLPAGQRAPLVLMRAGGETDDQFPTYTFGTAATDTQGFAVYSVPTSVLNPDRKPFDRFLFMGTRELAEGTFVELDKIALTGSAAVAKPRTATVNPAVVRVDCGTNRRPISPAIYGIAFNALTEESQRSQFNIGATSRRWGGDPTSRYNWEHGNAWNPGHNWFWRNMPVLNSGNAWQTFFTNNGTAGMTSALTIPTLGWVAKDTSSYSFPVSQRGAQDASAPELPDAGNGRAGGKDIVGPGPRLTSTSSTPDSVGRWIQAVNSGGFSRRSALEMVILDNEPDLWDASHRDIRLEPSTYDELLEKGIAYSTAIRAVDSQVKIAGPASWGWWGYFYSAADARAGFSAKPDRRAHGDIPFLEWYLAGMAKEEQRTGKRLLDILDVHYYPSGVGVYTGQGGNTDRATNEKRVRSTRSLWDKSYKEEGWVDSEVYLLPRLLDIVRTSKPGVGISIGEYNFGGERHMSGAVAQAEALGRFGQFGVSAAYLWTHPAQNSEQFWGFRAFRNYDGKGSNFGPFTASSSVSGQATSDLSVFASTDGPTRQKTMVLVNRSPGVAFDARVSLQRCGSQSKAGRWSYTGGPAGYKASSIAPAGGIFSTRIEPWSIQVLRVE